MMKIRSGKWCSVLLFPPVKGLLGSLLDSQEGAAPVKGPVQTRKFSFVPALCGAPGGPEGTRCGVAFPEMESTKNT